MLVGDSGFAALELLAALARHRITAITRLRLDAALHDPAPPRRPGTNGRPRTKGAAAQPGGGAGRPRYVLAARGDPRLVW
ncbi:hypothetical protein ACFQU7_43185 [Pseudoroseomonas wenyumeiae]